ncbi:MAG: serine/threonine protein kinase [Planctomycetota bacterium]
MDAERYARVRDLFFESDPLPRDRVVAFLKSKCGDDPSLVDDVLELLEEHDPDLAAVEGNHILSSPTDALHKATVSSAGGSATQKVNTATTTTTTTTTTHDGDGVGDAAGKRRGSEATLGGPLRTHATPRYLDEKPAAAPRPIAKIWAARTRRKFRITGAWLYLLSLVPTVLIGFWTYRQIRTQLERSIKNEFSAVLDSATLAADRFLNTKADLVGLWSQQPEIRRSVESLVKLQHDGTDVETLRSRPEIDAIENQLRQLSGRNEVKFVVWNSSLTTIASWLPERTDVGMQVHPDGAANLARVFSGETVLYGPARLEEDIPGFTPETNRPVMAILVPVRNDSGKIIAALLVRGLNWFDEFSSLFADISVSRGMDLYAADADGVMLTASVRAMALADGGRFDVPADRIPAGLRVANPGTTDLSLARPIRRDVLPITEIIADLREVSPGVRTEPYQNYAGQSVVGASRWLPEWNLGVVVEGDSGKAFGPLGLVLNGFFGLATLLAISSLVAAAKIAKSSTAEAAASHPLSRYEVLGTLGAGGMGMVYHVRHTGLGRDAALKILRGDRQHFEDQARFDREARLASSLINPHTVTIYDYGRSPDGDAYCVMEYLSGLTLNEVISRDGPQPIGRVLTILRQICDALCEAHARGLCHRDIKPHNIMLSHDPAAGDWAVVFDYGLAKPLQPGGGVFETGETVWAGTPMYMAPERFRDPSNLDPRSDLYAVGSVAYLLLAGNPPFAESDPESLFALILDEQPISVGIHRGEPLPESVEAMLQRMMAKDPADRYASVLDLAKDIDRLRSEHTWSVEQSSVWWRIHAEDAMNRTK